MASYLQKRRRLWYAVLDPCPDFAPTSASHASFNPLAP